MFSKNKHFFFHAAIFFSSPSWFNKEYNINNREIEIKCGEEKRREREKKNYCFPSQSFFFRRINKQ